MVGWNDLYDAYSTYYTPTPKTNNTWALKSTLGTNFDITTVVDYDLVTLFSTYESSLVCETVANGTSSASGFAPRAPQIKKVSFNCVNAADAGKYFTTDVTLGNDCMNGMTLTAIASTSIDKTSLVDGKAIIPMEMKITDVWGKTMTYTFNVEISL